MSLMKKKMKNIICLAWALTVVAFVGIDVSEAKVLNKSSKLYSEVMPIAVALKDAVINRRIDILIKYSNPDPLYSYAEFLDDKDSEEYKYLFDDAWNKMSKPSRKSVYGVLRNAKELSIILDLNEMHDRQVITAYYYDKTKIKLKVPLNPKTALLWGELFVTCRFVNTSDGWKVAYSIFDYGTDYILNSGEKEK